MRRFVRVLAWIAGGLLALALLFVLVLAIGGAYARHHSGWPPPAPGVRMEPARPILRADDIAADNAFHLLREVADYAGRPDSEEWTACVRSGWVRGTYSNLEAEVVRAAPFLDRLAAAAAMTNGQVQSEVRFAQSTPWPWPYHRLTQLQTFRAMQSFAEGRPEEGLDRLRVVLACDGHASRGAAIVVRLYVAAADLLALQVLRDAVEAGRLPPSALRSAAALVERRLGELEPWSEALRYEVLADLDAVSTAYQGGPLDVLGVFPASGKGGRRAWSIARPLLALVGSTEARSRSHVSAFFSQAIARADEPWRTRAFAQAAEPGGRIENPRVVDRFDDPVGRWLVAVLMPPLTATADRQAEVVAAFRAMDVILLAELRRHERGDWPVRIEDLVPDSLPAVPRDPFVPDGLIRLSRTGNRLAVYSVGANEVDDGGQVGPRENAAQRPLDIGWHLERAPVPAP